MVVDDDDDDDDDDDGGMDGRNAKPGVGSLQWRSFGFRCAQASIAIELEMLHAHPVANQPQFYATTTPIGHKNEGLDERDNHTGRRRSWRFEQRQQLVVIDHQLQPWNPAKVGRHP